MPFGRYGYSPSLVTSPSLATSGTLGTTGTRPITAALLGAPSGGSAVAVPEIVHGDVAFAREPSKYTSAFGPPSVFTRPGHGSRSPSRSDSTGRCEAAPKAAGVTSLTVIAGNACSHCGSARCSDRTHSRGVGPDTTNEICVSNCFASSLLTL